VITAFAFVNWAAASALSTVMTDWEAGLVLAAAWIAAGALVAALLLCGGPLSRNWRRVVTPASADNLQERQEAVDEAGQRLREAIDQFGDAVAEAAEQRIAAAVLPLAGGMVEVGEEMVEATDEIIDKADEITDMIEEKVPGGIVVNRVVDFVLVPGRFGIRVARSVLKAGPTV
jgi:methyl-accepting chemotaxis protein